MKEEKKDSDICLKTGERFVETLEAAKECEKCKDYNICPALNL
ncbi:MAG: hypothetical protein WBC21_00045 [Minisyncoccales bacterium]